MIFTVSVEYRQAGNRKVLTLLPGGCARTGFPHSGQTERKLQQEVGAK